MPLLEDYEPEDFSTNFTKKTVEVEIPHINVVYEVTGYLYEFRDLPCKFDIITMTRQLFSEEGHLISEIEVDQFGTDYIEAEACRIAEEEW